MNLTQIYEHFHTEHLIATGKISTAQRKPIDNEAAATFLRALSHDYLKISPAWAPPPTSFVELEARGCLRHTF